MHTWATEIIDRLPDTRAVVDAHGRLMKVSREPATRWAPRRDQVPGSPVAALVPIVVSSAPGADLVVGALVAAVAQTGVAIWLRWRGQHDAAMLAAALIVTTAGLERLDPPLAGCVTSTGNLEVAVIATALPTLCALALLQHLIGQTLCDVLAAATARSEELTHPDDGVAEIALAERTLRREIPRYALQKRFLARDGSLVWHQCGPGARGDPRCPLPVSLSLTTA